MGLCLVSKSCTSFLRSEYNLRVCIKSYCKEQGQLIAVLSCQNAVRGKSRIKCAAFYKTHSQKYGCNVHLWRNVLIKEIIMKFLVIFTPQVFLCSSCSSSSLETFYVAIKCFLNIGEFIYLRSDS